jgi:hypothetical protein
MSASEAQMDVMRLSSRVRRITLLQRDPTTQEVTPVELYRSAEKRRKSSRRARPAERVVRRWADANGSMASNYLARHRKSSRKRRDGWIRDLSLNMVRAQRKGVKRLRINRWFDA